MNGKTSYWIWILNGLKFIGTAITDIIGGAKTEIAVGGHVRINGVASVRGRTY